MKSAPAFTLLEVVVVAAVLLLLLLSFPKAGRTGATSRRERLACVQNLKSIGLAHRIFAADHNDRFPAEIAMVRENHATADIVTLLKTLTNELATPAVFFCPADTNRLRSTNWNTFAATNISYFFGLNAAETYPQSFLAGDSHLTVDGKRIGPGIVAIRTNALVGWSMERHDGSGITVMGDGSVQQLSVPRFREAFRKTAGEMRIWVP